MNGPGLGNRAVAAPGQQAAEPADAHVEGDDGRGAVEHASERWFRIAPEERDEEERVEHDGTEDTEPRPLSARRPKLALECADGRSASTLATQRLPGEPQHQAAEQDEEHELERQTDGAKPRRREHPRCEHAHDERGRVRAHHDRCPARERVRGEHQGERAREVRGEERRVTEVLPRAEPLDGQRRRTHHDTNDNRTELGPARRSQRQRRQHRRVTLATRTRPCRKRGRPCNRCPSRNHCRSPSFRRHPKSSSPGFGPQRKRGRSGAHRSRTQQARRHRHEAQYDGP